MLLYNSRFKFSAGKLASKWQGPLVIQEVYRSGAIRLHGDMKGKPHARKSFIGKVDEFILQTSEEVIAKKFAVSEIQNQ